MPVLQQPGPKAGKAAIAGAAPPPRRHFLRAETGISTRRRSGLKP